MCVNIKCRGVREIGEERKGDRIYVGQKLYLSEMKKVGILKPKIKVRTWCS